MFLEVKGKKLAGRGVGGEELFAPQPRLILNRVNSV